MPLKRRRSDVVWTLVWAGVLAANCTGQFTARIPRYLDSSTSNPGPLFSDGAYVYIVTTAAGSAGKSLYRFDANITAPITLMGNTVTGISAASTAYMTSWNGSVFLAADTLWQLTGSAFVNVNTNFTRVSFPTGDGDALYFAGDAGNNEGIELYQYTADEGVLLAGVVESGPTGSYPSSLVFMNGLLYFSAYSSLYGIELWVHNTSAPLPNAALALDLNPGVSDSLPGNLVTLDNILYFGADDGTHGSEFWKLVNGVFTVYDINPGSESSFPTDLTVIYNLVYFAATNDSVGTELFVYDPWGQTVDLAADINPGPNSSYPQALALFNFKLYFVALTPDTGLELFSYSQFDDLVLEVDLRMGPIGSSPSFLTAHSDDLYMIADDGGGQQLWQWTSESASPTATETATSSRSPTASVSMSRSRTPSITPTYSPTPSGTGSNSASSSATESRSLSSSVSESSTSTDSVTPSGSRTSTTSRSLTRTPTQSRSVTASCSESRTSSVTSSRSITASVTSSISRSSSVSVTPSITPTGTPTSSRSMSPSVTPTISVTSSITESKSLSSTPSVTPSVTMPSVTPSITPTRTVTPSSDPPVDCVVDTSLLTAQSQCTIFNPCGGGVGVRSRAQVVVVYAIGHGLSCPPALSLQSSEPCVVPAPSDCLVCGNGLWDAAVETDVDCGGSSCDSCAEGLRCLRDADCNPGAVCGLANTCLSTAATNASNYYVQGSVRLVGVTTALMAAPNAQLALKAALSSHVVSYRLPKTRVSDVGLLSFTVVSTADVPTCSLNMTTGSFSTNRAVDVAFFVKVPLDAHPDDYYHAVEVGHDSLAVRIQTTLAAVVGSICSVTVADTVVLKSVAQQPLVPKVPTDSSGLSSATLTAITVPTIIGGGALLAVLICLLISRRRSKKRDPFYAPDAVVTQSPFVRSPSQFSLRTRSLKTPLSPTGPAAARFTPRSPRVFAELSQPTDVMMGMGYYPESQPQQPFPGYGDSYGNPTTQYPTPTPYSVQSGHPFSGQPSLFTFDRPVSPHQLTFQSPSHPFTPATPQPASQQAFQPQSPAPQPAVTPRVEAKLVQAVNSFRRTPVPGISPTVQQKLKQWRSLAQNPGHSDAGSQDSKDVPSSSQPSKKLHNTLAMYNRFDKPKRRASAVSKRTGVVDTINPVFTMTADEKTAVDSAAKVAVAAVNPEHQPSTHIRTDSARILSTRALTRASTPVSGRSAVSSRSGSLHVF